MKCLECDKETPGKMDNRGKVHCDQCYAILPLNEVEVPAVPKPTKPLSQPTKRTRKPFKG